VRRAGNDRPAASVEGRACLRSLDGPAHTTYIYDVGIASPEAAQPREYLKARVHICRVKNAVKRTHSVSGYIWLNPVPNTKDAHSDVSDVML
jgi:hypothetical protein